MINAIDVEETNEKSFSIPLFIGILIGALVLGALSGFGISRVSGSKTTKTNSPITTSESTGKAAGLADKKTFKDSADGILREGGFEDEGNFHLERPGGKSQDAYLTSSTVDLSKFVGKKVRVWGQTFKGQKVGWLMDVGLVEALE